MGRLLVALACASLWVSGCSGATTSSTTDPPSSPTSSSPTSSPTPQPETPEEFVRRWVEVDRKMQNTGETAEYRKISQGCRACEGLADQIETIYQAGGFVKTKGWTVGVIKLSKPGAGGRILAVANITSAPTEYREAAEAPLQHLDGGKLVERMTLQPQGLSWVLVDLEQQAQ